MTRKRNSKFVYISRLRHCEDVYDAVYLMHRMVSANEIEEYLKQKNRNEEEKLKKEFEELYEKGLETKSASRSEFNNYVKQRLPKLISLKTIKRCLKDDERIDKKGHYYFISNGQRFDSKFLDPVHFGMSICKDIVGSYVPSNNLEKDMGQLVLRYGTFIILSFIESAIPLMDKDMSIRDKEDLIYYWAVNSVPLSYMFDIFEGTFQQRKTSLDWKTPPSEMNPKKIKSLQNMIQQLYPDIYEDFLRGRIQTFGKTVKIKKWGIAYDPVKDSLAKKKKLKK